MRCEFSKRIRCHWRLRVAAYVMPTVPFPWFFPGGPYWTPVQPCFPGLTPLVGSLNPLATIRPRQPVLTLSDCIHISLLFSISEEIWYWAASPILLHIPLSERNGSTCLWPEWRHFTNSNPVNKVTHGSLTRRLPEKQDDGAHEFLACHYLSTIETNHRIVENDFPSYTLWPLTYRLDHKISGTIYHYVIVTSDFTIN